jgi:plasmid stabilization system protein ParE
MRPPLIFLPEAEQEFKEAVTWYARQKKGLGKKFAQAVKRSLKGVQATPKMHACVVDDVRKATMKVFPYVILYRVTTDNIIIVAVFHAKRDPRVWQERI